MIIAHNLQRKDYAMAWQNGNMYGQNAFGYNPYQPTYQSPTAVQTGRQSIVRVNGENGARALQLPPNSEMLALDNTQAIVWLAQTDGAGYLSVTPYDIAVHQEKPPFDIQSLLNDVEELKRKVYGESNSTEVK